MALSLRLRFTCSSVTANISAPPLFNPPHLAVPLCGCCGSAPRREADSQPINQLVRQAVSQTVSQASRQADRNTQFRFFFSVAGLASCSGEDIGCQNKPQSNGNAAGRTLESWRFESRLADYQPR